MAEERHGLWAELGVALLALGALGLIGLYSWASLAPSQSLWRNPGFLVAFYALWVALALGGYVLAAVFFKLWLPTSRTEPIWRSEWWPVTMEHPALGQIVIRVRWPIGATATLKRDTFGVVKQMRGYISSNTPPAADISGYIVNLKDFKQSWEPFLRAQEKCQELFGAAAINLPAEFHRRKMLTDTELRHLEYEMVGPYFLPYSASKLDALAKRL